MGALRARAKRIKCKAGPPVPYFDTMVDRELSEGRTPRVP